MKNLIKNAVMMIAALLVSASCNGNNSARQKKDAQSETASQDKTMKSEGKVLIVFFSHAGENYGVGNVKVGNTKLVAEEICKVTGGDLFEIVPEKNYDLPYDELTKVAKQETEKGEKPAYKGDVADLVQYDTVFIGGPVWWGTYPQVMFTFFEKHDLNGKTVIPFTTHEGSGLGSVVDDLKRLYPNAHFGKAFSIYGHETRKDLTAVDKWLKELKY